jgi:SAM-dependent methyltransferase
MTKRPGPPQRQPYSQQIVEEFFRFHVRMYGHDWRSLGWYSRHTQYQRFAVLAEVGELAHRSLLDVGSGLGDFYHYLHIQGIPVDYTGYDLLPEMVTRAQTQYPGVRFEVRDVLQGLGEERFDYIVSSGAFNVNFGDNLTAVRRVLGDMLLGCRRGVAINFLKRTPDASRDPIFHYYDPQNMLAWCQTICPHVQLREDYLPNDFTLYLYPAPPP